MAGPRDYVPAGTVDGFIEDEDITALESVAFHEAGHVWAAFALGWPPPLSATIVADADCAGRVVYQFVVNTTTPDQHARAAAFGPIAQGVWAYKADLKAGCELEDPLHYVAAAIEDGGGPDLSKAGSHLADPDLVLRHWETLLQNWSGIAALAAALLHRRTMTGAECYALLLPVRAARTAPVPVPVPSGGRVYLYALLFFVLIVVPVFVVCAVADHVEGGRLFEDGKGCQVSLTSC